MQLNSWRSDENRGYNKSQPDGALFRKQKVLTERQCPHPQQSVSSVRLCRNPETLKIPCIAAGEDTRAPQPTIALTLCGACQQYPGRGRQRSFQKPPASLILQQPIETK